MIRLPSDNLTVPRISVRHGSVEHSPLSSTRLRHLRRLRVFKTVLGFFCVLALFGAGSWLLMEGIMANTREEASPEFPIEWPEGQGFGQMRLPSEPGHTQPQPNRDLLATNREHSSRATTSPDTRTEAMERMRLTDLQRTVDRISLNAVSAELGRVGINRDVAGLAFDIVDIGDSLPTASALTLKEINDGTGELIFTDRENNLYRRGFRAKE